jgi:hypothetical protein
MAQTVECLTSKHEVLSSNSSTAKKKSIKTCRFVLKHKCADCFAASLFTLRMNSFCLMQWFMSAIPATVEVEIRRIAV